MIKVLDQKYYTQTRGVVSQSELKACIGEKIKVETTIYSEIVCVASADLKITFKPYISELRITADNSNVISIQDTEFISSLAILDTFDVIDSTSPSSPVVGSYTVIEKLSDSIIRVQEDLTAIAENSYIGGDGDSGYLVNTTPYKFLGTSWGVTLGGYASPTTGELQAANISSSGYLSDISETLIPILGGKGWQTGSIKILGAGDGYGSQQIIKITNEFIVTPLFLETELDDLLVGIRPSFWKKPDLIKYKAEFIFAKSKQLALDNSKLTVAENGEFGWFNCKTDNSAPNFELVNLELIKVSDSSSVNALEFSNEVQCIATIKKVSGGLVTPSDNVIIVGFNYLPQSESFYKNNSKTLTENFLYDSVKIILGGGEENGEQNGTDSQIIKTAEATAIDSTTFEVRFNIEFGADIIPILRQDSEAWYNTWLICEDISVDLPLSDKSSVLVQTNKVYEQLIEIDLFDNDAVFIEHPYESTYFGKETLEIFPVDDVIANSLLQLDYTGRESDNIKIIGVEPSLILTHATEADIYLERTYINCENFDLVGTSPAIQDIEYIEDRVFKLPANDARKGIVFARDYTNDSGSIKAWVLSYPFMNRWEYWNKLTGLTNIPSDLFSASLPNKGINQFWNRLANISGWSLKYRARLILEQNGVQFEQSFEDILSSQDFEANTDWSVCSIKSYDSVSNNEIIAGGSKYLDAAKKTKIVASFKKTNGTLPAENFFAIVIWIMRFEEGTIADITRYSSVYADDGISMFDSIDTSKKVVLQKIGDVYTGTCFVDNTKISANTTKMTVYARIYEISGTEFNVRITNDNKVRELLDANVRQII